jgi:hypothetical protein
MLPSHPPWLDNSNYTSQTSFEAPHYAASFNLLSLHPFSVQIFSSAPCSQTPSVYAGFEVFTAVVLKSIIFWDMTPCSP